MKLFPAKCPSCGGDIELDENSKVIKCDYCNTSIVVEDDDLIIQKKQFESNDDSNSRNNKIGIKGKIIMIVLTILLLVANVIAIKVSWDYENSLGSVAFVFSLLLTICAIKNLGLGFKSLLIVNIIGIILFIGALWFSLFIHNYLPGYVNTWENNNMKLTIDRKTAIIEFKGNGIKEENSYSTAYYPKFIDGKYINYTKIIIADYFFLYSDENKTMCYTNEKNECVEDLKIVDRISN